MCKETKARKYFDLSKKALNTAKKIKQLEQSKIKEKRFFCPITKLSIVKLVTQTKKAQTSEHLKRYNAAICKAVDYNCKALQLTSRVYI